MNKILKSLLAMPLALLLAFVFVSYAPAKIHADGDQAAAVSDNQFVDGNWFTIADAKGEAYGTGTPTNVALEAQLALYQEAVEAKDTAKAEKYAIRSWVKANYAADLGLTAIESGDTAAAQAHLARALKYAKAAQKPNAGKGEQKDRVCDDTADAWRGCSAIEGKRAEKYVRKLMKRLPKATQATDGE
jgi:hypothetical protein